jgi:photosystem II stability/assembly factor-like uncharacterized protein
MKKLIILIVINFSTSFLFSQTGWFWQNPYPQGNDLYDAVITSSNRFLLVGDGGMILKSENSGSNWTINTTISIPYLRSVHFINGLTGWISSQSKILKTTDGGNTWINYNISNSWTLETIFFLNEHVGYTAGHWGRIFKTINGGLNWVQQTSNSNKPLLCCYFTDTNTGWVGGWDGEILKTTNGGETWDSLSTGIISRFTSVFFRNSNTGWMTSQEGNIFNTTNGGNSWISRALGSPLYSLHFINDLTGWTSGTGIFKTTNGGQSWIPQAPPVQCYYSTIYFADDQNGIAAGNSGVIIKTHNSGINWVPVSLTATSNEIYDISFIDAQTGWASSYNGKILSTGNGGLNWNTIFDNPSFSFRLVQFLNANTGWAASVNVYKSTNSGANWIVSYTGSQFMYSIDVNDADNIWAAGNYGNIVKTTNGGNNWTLINTGFSGTLNDICFVDNQTGWVSGYNQSIFKSINGGINWILQYGGTGYPGYVQSISFINNLTGWAGIINPGNTNTLLKTTNGGLNWSLVCTGMSYHFSNIFFTDILTGWYNNSGEIYRSTNGGIQWQYQGGSFSGSLNKLFFINSQTGWAAGFNGNILKTTSGGEPVAIINYNNNFPEKFSLSQNYPNPFNPATKIRFQISRSVFTKLTVFDILGREVSTLVNEQLNPGTYEVDWDASAYPSGVYFYRLETGTFNQTLKMVLIK